MNKLGGEKDLIGLGQEKREGNCVHSTTQTAMLERKFPKEQGRVDLRGPERGPHQETKGQEKEITES